MKSILEKFGAKINGFQNIINFTTKCRKREVSLAFFPAALYNDSVNVYQKGQLSL